MVRLTILSPHRDDAAFSLCLALSHWSSLQIRCRVLNVFTRSGYAPWIESKEPQIVSATRREEDRAVLREISSQIEVHDADFLDAPLRTGLQVDQVCNSHVTELIDEDLLQALELTFSDCRSELVLAPLTLGNHIDHVAVRQAAMRAFPASRLGFYEDLPYAMWTSEEVLTGKVNGAEKALCGKLHSFRVCEPLATGAKAQVIAGYRSQITIEEANSIASWSEQFEGGERIWIPANSEEWQLLTG